MHFVNGEEVRKNYENSAKIILDGASLVSATGDDATKHGEVQEVANSTMLIIMVGVTPFKGHDNHATDYAASLNPILANEQRDENPEEHGKVLA